jgi:hypothetical protein
MTNFLAALLFLAATAAQPSGVTFDGPRFDFGKVPQGKPVSHSFTFINGTKLPVVIESVSAESSLAAEYLRTRSGRGRECDREGHLRRWEPGTFARRASVKFSGIAEPSWLTLQGEVISPPKP